MKLSDLTQEERVRIGEKGAEDLLGSCAGAYESTYCPEGMDVDDFLALVAEFGDVDECQECGWYAETSEFDDDNRCQECQDNDEQDE